jgi:hypothetical protein
VNVDVLLRAAADRGVALELRQAVGGRVSACVGDATGLGSTPAGALRALGHVLFGSVHDDDVVGGVRDA